MDELLFGDRFRATEKIAASGEKETYRGTDAGGEPVIIKTIFLSDRTSASLLEDLKSVSMINHPGIAKIYDYGQTGYQSWMVREYISGNDLKSVLSGERRLSPTITAEIGVSVCEGLSAAHARDIVHGNIKPQNIIWGDNELIKLVDFGFGIDSVAAIQEREALPELAYYLSPEQAMGRPATPSSDIYALGAVLYEAATGRVPFFGESAVDVANMQIHNVPRRPQEINAAVPTMLQQVILKAMAKDPVDRYGSTEEMKQDLERYLESEKTTVLTTQQTTRVAPVAATAPVTETLVTRKPVWLWAIGFLAVALLALLLFFLLRQPTETVPDVVGMSQTQAERELEDAGFRVGDILPTPATGTIAPGTVTAQEPPAGEEAPRNSSVSLTVAQAAQATAVPDVVGESEENARAALRDAGFVVAVEREFDDTIPQGAVISQNPPANSQAPRGSTVTLTVSNGPQSTTTTTEAPEPTTTTSERNQVDVPDVVGQSRASAVSILRAAGFQVTVRRSPSDTVPAEEVIFQNPEAGTTVNEGSNVTIVVSEGPPESPTTSST